jgi:glycosyltransferase involved in cell wall biosynthesis
VSQDAQPKVSIVIATYNWSSALRCAIGSALLQTFEDFEILVVGDACTDDSREVALSFGDPRVRWMNLPTNSGGQAVPNNHGISNSRGQYIAYLGHDDIWFPTHLKTLLETVESKQADLVGAVTVLFGPPGSEVLGLSGVLATGEWCASDFFPPSSILHKKSLTDRIGPWKEPWTLELPSDVEFENRAFASGAKIVSTNQLTVFKFNAAWRRNAYLDRPVAELSEMLARIRSGIDFREELLAKVLSCVLSDKFARIEAPPRAPGEFARFNARYKDTSKETVDLRRVEGPLRFNIDHQLGGFEWHPPEQHGQLGSFRWSGPSRMSSLEFPVLRDRDLAMRLHAPWHLQCDLSQDLRLAVDGEPVVGGSTMHPSSLPLCPRRPEPAGLFESRFRSEERNVPPILAAVRTGAGSVSP